MKQLASSSWSVLWRSLMFFCVFVLSVVCAASVESALPDTGTAAAGLLLESIPFFGLLLGTLAVGRWTPPRSGIDAGLATRNAATHCLIGLLAGVAWIAVALLILAAVAEVRVDITRIKLNSATVLAAAAMFANVGMQQLLTRGYLLGVIEWKFGVVAAVVTTSLIFLLLHPGAFEAGTVAVVNVALAGLIFGLARWITSGLYLAVGLHFAWKFTGAVVLGLIPLAAYPAMDSAQISGNAIWIGGPQGIETGLAVTLANGLLDLALMAVLTARRGRA